MKKLIYLFLLMPLLGISQAKFGGNSVAAARATLKNSSTYTLTYVDGIFYLVSTTSSFPIAFSTVGATGTGNLVYSASPTLTGTLTTSVIANTAGANFATTSGNVGIGTVSPTEKLYVIGNSYTSGAINTGNSVGLYNVNQMIINPAYGGTVAAVQVVNNAPLSFITNNFQRLTITGTGNVGIGTTSPAGILHAASTTSFALLCPMTTTQRNALSGLVSGAEIYCSDCTATDSSTGVKQVYNGSTWKNCW